MKQKLLLFFCFLFAALLKASADELYYDQDFDQAADYAEGSYVPKGWLSKGTLALYRQKASDMGASAHSGSYVFGNVGSYMGVRDEIVYTPGFTLVAGKVCTFSFWLYAPGGSPASVRNTQIKVTAGTAQTKEAQTVKLGQTPKQAHSTWTKYSFEFTPETEGEYFFALHLVTTIAQSGLVAFDDIVVEGETPAPPVPANELQELSAAYADGFDFTAPYTYKGEAIVSYVNTAAGVAYLQDVTAGAKLLFPAAAAPKAGDKISDLGCTLALADGVLTMTIPGDAAAPAFTTVSEGNALPAQSVTLEALAAEPQLYAGKLIAVDSVTFSNIEAGDVFEEGLDYTLTDGTSSIALGFLPGDALYDEGIPTEVLKVTGIALSGTTATIAPRTLEDMQKYTTPIVHDTKELPYQQSFDNENEDYDGTSQLPTGWACTGTVPFVTANMDGLLAHGGTYYLITPEGSFLRDERLYTPFFDMEAGKTYVYSFYLYLPGKVSLGTLQPTNVTVTVGNDQESSAQTTTLLTLNGQSLTSWTKQEVKFVPMVSGQYCFAVNLFSESPSCGDIAIDDVTVFEEGSVMRPTAEFGIPAWYDVYESRVCVFRGTAVQMINLSTEATEYEWSIPGANPATSTEKNPAFFFPEEGTYTITLTAKNSRFSKTTTKEIKVYFPTDEGQLGLMNYNPSEDKMISYFDEMPTYPTDPEFDYISGFNHYYYRYAQRYALPEETKMTISSISTWLVAYSRMSAYTAEERNWPFTISFYGETNGKLDETKCFGRKISTLVDEFGNVGIGYEHPKMWGFSLESNPITVQGNFYVAFEYDPQIPIDSPDPNITRSYIALSLAQSRLPQSNMYVYPTSGPEGFTKTNQWCSLNEFDASKEGYSLALILWAKAEGAAAPEGIMAIGTDGKPAFAARPCGDNLNVSGTEAGERLTLFDASGRLVRTAAAETGATQISLGGLSAGTYIIMSSKGAVKFVKK